MGDIGDGDGQSEIDAIVGRISALAHGDQQRRGNGSDEQLVAALNAALAFLPELRLRTLQTLEADLARPDSLAVCGVLYWGSAGEPGPAKFVIRFASPPSYYTWASRSAASIDAALLDLLLFRDVLLAYGDYMFFECLAGVKDILGLGQEDSLAERGAGKYGARGVASVLHSAVCIAGLQLKLTSAYITPQMGYAGVGAYADAKDDCHFMTAAMARWILRHGPGPDEIAGLAGNGRLGKFDISPSGLDAGKLRAELSKLDLSGQASALETWNALGPGAGPAGTGHRRRASLADIDDGGKRSFEVRSPPGPPATVGDALEKHISRRSLNSAMRRLTVFCWVAVPCAVLATTLWRALPLIGELLAGPPLTAAKGIAVFVLAELACGVLLAMGIASWLDLRNSGFFLMARELSRYTVLQGRRGKDFLKALRVLRPGLFQRSGTAGLPRLFSLCFSRDGALLIGGGPSPGVIATFPWQTVQDIRAEPPVRGRKRPFKPGQRVVVTISHEGGTVPLAFPLERAKVAWTARTYLEAKPLEAALGSVQGLQTTSLAGPEFFRWETPQPRPQASASTAYLRRRKAQIARGMVAVVLLSAAGPYMLGIFLR